MLSATSGFSMKTLRPRSIAYWKWTQRNASGVARITMSPGCKAVHRFLVGVEADELLVFGDMQQVWLRLILLFECVDAFVQPVLEDVGHRDQLGRVARRGERVDNCARAASAATNQGDLQIVIQLRPRQTRAGTARAERAVAAPAYFNEIATIGLYVVGPPDGSLCCFD